MNEQANTTPYISDSFRMLLNVVAKNLISQSDIQIIKGEEGIGKSTFCKQLKIELTKKAQIFIINGHSQIRANEVFKTMLLNYQQKLEPSLRKCLISLAHYLKTSIESTGSVVIIIDDAHKIVDSHLEYILQSLEALIEILHQNLKILLVGDASIERRITKFNLKEIKRGKIHSSMIRPITKNQYIAFLTHCGFKQEKIEPLLSNKKTLKLLHKQSFGIPKSILQNFQELSTPTQDLKTFIKKKLIQPDKKLLILVSVLLVIFFTLLLIPFESNEIIANKNLRNSKSILEIDDNFYTIQLLAVSNKQLLIRFSQKYPELKNMYFYKKKVNNSLELYVLLLGKLSFKDVAQEVLSSLPNDLKAMKPFIRKFSKIKTEINNGR